MKQTAVEWLYEKIKSNIDAEDGSMNMNWLYDDTFQQAKEMEKQQIIDAITQYEIKNNKIFSEQGILNVVNKAKEYYNQTFNK